eukprot:g9120.t1
MSKAADEAQQNPVGHPTVFEDMPSTTDGQRQKLTKQSSRKPKSYLPFLLSSRAAVVCNRAFSKPSGSASTAERCPSKRAAAHISCLSSTY